MDSTNEGTPIIQSAPPMDTATSNAEDITSTTHERDTAASGDSEERPNKRARIEDANDSKTSDSKEPQSRQKGVAPIKAEYLLPIPERQERVRRADADDDAAEGACHQNGRDGDQRGRDSGKKEKNRGQNKGRGFGNSRDSLQLCSTRVYQPEFSPLECQFGEKCKYEHDLRKYLTSGKREDLKTFDGLCPVWKLRGQCNMGWKCRFVGSHSQERETDDGRKELVLVEDAEQVAKVQEYGSTDGEVGVANVVSKDIKWQLSRKQFETPKADKYLDWLENETERRRKQDAAGKESKEALEENRAQYKEPPLLASEKRRIYYGSETPVLAPLTTQGNLPFRRLCVSLGAQVTWSEMAMGLPLIQGQKGEWALMKAHESEITPPKFTGANETVEGYDNSKDLKFGAQIAANKPWLAFRTAETIALSCPRLRAIDLNCGCPIDLVFREGSGSALLDAPSKLEKMLRGMNAVSGEIPITVKIRMGTKDNQPTAEKLVKRLIYGGPEQDSASGVAAITLHGRSRQQRYTRRADWSYISECATVIRQLKEEQSAQTDTANETDLRFQAGNGKVYFVGNGDCFSHEEYYNQIKDAKVDSVMVARGAMIKPWIFEEIEKNQYLDKSATERLGYIEKFAKNGLEVWGSDEQGIGTTRRFLLEWLSFACRYIPVGILDHLPPNIQDRPPRFRGRNELETLLSSDNYKDWIKISEMFLGPAHPNFRFEPKHKSNSYEMVAEG